MVATLAQAASAAYYLESQRSFRHPNEYYTAGEEPDGVWFNPNGLFGLVDGGKVDSSNFHRLYNGFAPDSGGKLTRNAGSERRSAGLDMTFSADKSVSALWAIADPELRSEIDRAHNDAARVALEETVLRHCAYTRIRNRDGEIEVLPADIAAAMFQHGTSRDNDPQLHTHCVIFNAARTHRDGKYRALHQHPVYTWMKAAGAVYRNALAWSLQERLGIRMEQYGKEGEFTRVAGIPEDLTGHWSKRRAAIIDAAREMGFTVEGNAPRAAAANKITRAGKSPDNDPEIRHRRWRGEADGFIEGSIRELYASSCYGGGETGPVIGAGGEADEVEPAQVVVQIAGGDAAAGTQEVLQPAVAAVHRLHMQIAPNPFPHRAVERFVAHPERGGARWVARATVGDQQGVLRDHRVESSRERRRIDPGQHSADRRPAPVRRHENRHLLARKAALLRLAAPPPCLASQPARALPALQDVGLVRFHDPLEHLRIASRRRQKPVTPAERRAHRHVAARRRGLHRLPLRQRRPERQPAFLVVQARQRRTAQRVEGPAAALALVAPQTPRHTARNRPFARAVRTAPGLVHTKLDRGLRCLALAPARQHRERLAPLRARQPARRRKPHLETLAVHNPTS